MMGNTEPATYVCCRASAAARRGTSEAMLYRSISDVWGRGWAAIQGPDHSSSNSIMRTSISRFSLKM